MHVTNFIIDGVCLQLTSRNSIINGVPTMTKTEKEGIFSFTTDEKIIALPTLQQVITTTTKEGVIPLFTV